MKISTPITSQFSKGFTLIELIVVIAIIGILTTILIASFGNVREKNRDAKRKSDLKQLQVAFELYRNDVGMYPASLPACNTSLANAGIVYMQKVPCDPIAAAAYTYTVPTDRLTYGLRACLENTNDQDPDINTTVTGCPTGRVAYVLTSP